MKKSLTVVLLAALLTAGCSGKAAVDSSAKPTVEQVAATPSAAELGAPDEVGKRLDKAEDELKALGFKVASTDVVEGKTIIKESNWEVISQDPAAGTTAAKGTKVKLGVKHLTSTPSPTSTPTPTPVPVVGGGAGTGGGAEVNVNPPAVPNVPAAPPAPNVGGAIICKDGYVWPNATRQGACSRHGGIAG